MSDHSWLIEDSKLNLSPKRNLAKLAKDIVIGYLPYTVFPYLYIYSKNKYLLSHE